MMKKILVLGAGIYQVPLIKKIKELGHYAIVTSIPGDYPGFEFADKVYYADTIDKDAILSIARDEKIDAILVTGTDVAVNTLGYICDTLELPGITSEVAMRVTNKAVMKKCMIENGIRTPIFERVYTLEEAYKACETIGFPVVFKCVDKSGSRGIYKAVSENDVTKAYQYSMGSTNLNYIIVEKFINGYEIGVDGYIGEDSIFIVPHDKIVYNNGFTNVPIGHVFPYECNNELDADIKEQIVSTAKALRIKNSFFNADVMICDNKSYILEIGARCGATCIPELISIHYDIDYYELMIKKALGENIQFPEIYKLATIGQLLFSETSGCIQNVEADIEHCEGFEQFSIDYKTGAKIPAFKVGPDRIGQIIVSGKTVSEAKKHINYIKEKIKIKVE